jgi:hypothetical protein
VSATRSADRKSCFFQFYIFKVQGKCNSKNMQMERAVNQFGAQSFWSVSLWSLESRASTSRNLIKLTAAIQWVIEVAAGARQQQNVLLLLVESAWMKSGVLHLQSTADLRVIDNRDKTGKVLSRRERAERGKLICRGNWALSLRVSGAHFIALIDK